MAQGTLCSNAYSLNLNGVINNYATSAATSGPAVCTNSSPSTSPVTWFSFTTNASAQCPLISIRVSDNQACEVALYTWCNSSVNSFIVGSSSMCFEDGEGLWAPNENYALQPNYTYYLRIKTATACTISIGGQHITPANNNCAGATPIGTQAVADNNACHKPGQGITPSQMCAGNLENTSFYKFYVASTGSAIINIANISCDNGNTNNSSGFQVGFFTGSCGNLVPLNCETGSGSLVQATTQPLPAGSLIYVAIDGVSGSNCRYSISGVNVYGVLSTNFKNFAGWKSTSANIIKWTSTYDSSSYYIIERSLTGTDFAAIGRVMKPAGPTIQVNYEFADRQPTRNAYYRVIKVDASGNMFTSHVIRILREEQDLLDLNIRAQPTQLQLEINAPNEERVQYSIINASGQVFHTAGIALQQGKNLVTKNISSLPHGKYFVMVHTGKKTVSKGFLKQF
jgi:hypothetical protein